jgi:hypothetical protein
MLLARATAFAVFLTLANGALACLQAPLPTTPTGPTWSAVYEDRLTSGTLLDSTEVTAWRFICPDDEPLLLLTFEPIEDVPFVCSGSFDVIEGGVQYGNFRLTTSSGGSTFCGDLLVKSTFIVEQRTTEEQWNDRNAFSLAWDSDVFLQVGAFDPADYGTGSGAKALDGSLSGSWFDPTRNGEGFALEFGENVNGPVATIYWFTHRDGVPYWLIGSTPYEQGQTEISFNLLEVSGTGFGAAFDSDEIGVQQAGILSLEYSSCQSGFAAWEMTDGESGTFELERVTAGLHQVDCQ